MSDFVQYLRGNNTKAPYSKESTRAKIVTENSKKEILFTDTYNQNQYLSFPFTSMEYTGVLRSGADELEYELSGIEQGTRAMTPEVARAIEGVRFIADHLKEEDEANNVSQIRITSITFSFALILKNTLKDNIWHQIVSYCCSEITFTNCNIVTSCQKNISLVDINNDLCRYFCHLPLRSIWKHQHVDSLQRLAPATFFKRTNHHSSFNISRFLVWLEEIYSGKSTSLA